MHILQVSPYVIHPPKTGGDHRSHGLVKEFPAAGSRVTRYCQGSSPSLYKSLDFRRRIEVQDGYVEHRHLNPVHDLGMAPVLFGYPNVLAGNALEIAPGPLPSLLSNADIVMVREPWQLPTVLNRTDSPVVYSSHNAEFERFDDSIPGLFDSKVYDRLVELERIAVEQSDAVVCTSERDEQLYRQRFDVQGQIIISPNGSYKSNIRPHNPESPAAQRLRYSYGIDDSTTVGLFMGSDYGPNVEAAHAVLDLAEEVGHNEPFHFLIIGTVGNAIETDAENVTVTGFVDEFEDHFDASDIALNPMLSGGGTNIKILDYFARSLPVLSTPFGVRGIEIMDGENVVVRSLDEFHDALFELREQDDRRADIGIAARKLVANRYTWEGTSRDLHDRLRTLLE